MPSLMKVWLGDALALNPLAKGVPGCIAAPWGSRMPYCFRVQYRESGMSSVIEVLK